MRVGHYVFTPQFLSRLGMYTFFTVGGGWLCMSATQRYGNEPTAEIVRQKQLQTAEGRRRAQEVREMNERFVALLQRQSQQQSQPARSQGGGDKKERQQQREKVQDAERRRKDGK